MGWSILFVHTAVLTADDYNRALKQNLKEEMLALNSIPKHNGSDTSFTET